MCSSPVFSVNGCLERADCVERSLPSRAGRVGEIGLLCYASVPFLSYASIRTYQLAVHFCPCAGTIAGTGGWASRAQRQLWQCQQALATTVTYGGFILGWASFMAALGFAFVLEERALRCFSSGVSWMEGFFACLLAECADLLLPKLKVDLDRGRCSGRSMLGAGALSTAALAARALGV
ncbi:hypothetical protein P154DRAFT_227578 [Amniculicola lignicola CBS 123094]|uniref:Uncharacterized protein n=1 Tax=Amniculicola lignicola CBS 123094 TaxID=1392246 RepID=A0A6A5WK69_9PLEO|nr:hypothetical protein P154DRAFT_227578 [Amniculicola lignicola CBS 123094]